MPGAAGGGSLTNLGASGTGAGGVPGGTFGGNAGYVGAPTPASLQPAFGSASAAIEGAGGESPATGSGGGSGLTDKLFGSASEAEAGLPINTEAPPLTDYVTNPFDQKLSGPSGALPDMQTIAGGRTPAYASQVPPGDSFMAKVGRVGDTGNLSEFLAPGNPVKPYAQGIENAVGAARNIPQDPGSPEDAMSPLQGQPEIPAAGLFRSRAPADDAVRQRYAQLMASLRR